MNPDFIAAIPQALKALPRWLCWRAELRKNSRAGEKQTKVPYCATTGREGSSTDPRTWSDFQTATAAVDRLKCDGIGFVLNGDGLVGIDFDHCIDDDGTIEPWAAEFLNPLNSYTEFSPSGRGFRVFVYGKLPPKGRKKGRFEIYDTGRYLTCTGHHVDGYPLTVETRPAEILMIHAKVWPPKNMARRNRTPSRTVSAESITDQELLKLARKARNGRKFSALFDDGIVTDYPSQSEADLALCRMLAFYTKDPDRIAELVRQSALYRDKWDRDDYRERTIRAVIERTPDTYSRGPKRNHSRQGSVDSSLETQAKREAREERAAIQSESSRREPETGTNRNTDDVDTKDDSETERPSEYSDDAITDAFSQRFANDLKFVPQWGWVKWFSTRWQRVSDVVVMQHARRICRRVAAECRNDPTMKGAAERLARTISSAKTVAAVERLARGDPRHLSAVTEWDTDLWLFNTPGGTVDLRTGSLRPHQREDRITKIANATSGGDCPRWMAFLNRVTADNQELQRYLQRLAGYSLCGDPSEECVDYCYGTGGNGKGTFLGTLEYSIGEYATTAAMETFMESKTERHPCDIAKLAGARLVVAQEVDEGHRWDEARMKAMTGRDTMTGRFMRQDFFDFKPQFTLIIVGNHKPSFKTVDDAIRRRFHLVPFTVSIPDEDRDPGLKEALRNEADGILAWAVAGCLEWQRQGLKPPPAVLNATSEYLADEDTLGQWMNDCCLKDNDAYEESSSWLHTSYRRWKELRGEQPPGQKNFSSTLSDRGFIRDRSASVRKFKGIRLTDDERKSIKALIEREKGEEDQRGRGGI